MGNLIVMKAVKFGMTALAAFVLASMGRAEAPADVEYVDGQRVFIKTPNWFPKEDGEWLFNCRLEAAAERLVKPIAHLHFYILEGEGEDAEITWEHKAIVRRNKFDKNHGSRKASFIRVYLKDLPADIESLTVEFKNEPPNKKSEE